MCFLNDESGASFHRRYDTLTCQFVSRPQIVDPLRRSLQRPDRGRPNGDHPIAARACGVDEIRSRCADRDGFAVHFVFGQTFLSNRAKRVETNVQCDECEVDAAQLN